ncbi:hypothetical protein Nepgr_026357 [Nepenthes gracilis]|uniref:Uncharacterized protein n=1 Tax=Nepenthes gracilis TaxID=150966 RepID=A0AAD3T8W8_NEPGR|nr:hypothetical protein Nepgr_026357 [Nepenthes gracilis]
MAEQRELLSSSTGRKNTGAEMEDLTDSDMAAAQQLMQLSEGSGDENSCSSGSNKNAPNRNTENKKRKNDDREDIELIIRRQMTSRKIVDRLKRRRSRYRGIAEIYQVTKPIDLINRIVCEWQI